jgi:PAS domain S-box-containing protein
MRAMEATRRTILIVDGTPEDRASLGRLLDRVPGRPYRWLEAASGRDALPLIDAERLDCILLSDRLSDLEGAPVLERLLSAAGQVAIVVVSSTDDGMAAISRGAHGWVTRRGLKAAQLRQAIEQSRLYLVERRMRHQETILAAAGQRLAESLDPDATLNAVAELIVPSLADWCIVDLLTEAGTVERAAVVHADPTRQALARGLHRYAPDLSRPDGGADALRLGRTDRDATVTDEMLVKIARDDEHLALLRALSPVSHIRVPLLARGRVLGSLLLISAESGRQYGAEDQVLIEELAGRCGLALDNARLHADQERAGQRAAALVEATRVLSESSATPKVMLVEVARLAAELLGDLAIVRLLSADQRWLDVAAFDHADPAARAEAATALLDERHPVDVGANGAALREGQPVRISDQPLEELRRESDPRLWPSLTTLPTAALLAVPLRTADRAIGTLSVSRSDPGRAYSADDERFLQALADRAAIAVERARLYEAERQTHERATFLAEASASLIADVEYADRLRALSRLAVPVLADWCVVDLLADDGSLLRMAAAHANPALQPIADELVRRYPRLPAGTSHTIVRVIGQGAPWIDPDIAEERFVAEARDADHLDLMRQLGMASEMVVPLVARGRVLGTITLVFSTSGRRHTPDDLTLAQDLAGRAGLALDSARLLDQIRFAEARYRALFEGTADPSFVLDASGRLLEANEAAVTITGYAPAELRRMTIIDLVADRVTGEAELAAVAQGGFWRGELEIRRKDGTIVPVEAQTTAVSVPDGTIYVSALRDIGERRALERLQRELLAAVSHDLKNPLASVVGHAQLMRRRQVYSERSINSILSESRRLARLIDDLLDVTRAEAGQLTLRCDWGDLLTVIQAAVDAAQEVSATHRIELLAPDGPVVALFDPDRLEQIVQNLLLNAIKYSPDGGLVRVDVEECGNEIRITVTDDGIGISADALPNLFGRFYRSPEARDRRLPGLGLGLFVTRSLVEAHGGRIWAESDGAGQGSTFITSLPRQSAEQRSASALGPPGGRSAW